MDPTARPGATRDAPSARAGLRDAGPVGRGALVALLVAVAVVASSLAGPWNPAVLEDEGPVPTIPPGTPAPVPSPVDPLVEALRESDVEPWDLTWLRVGLAVVVVVVGVYLLVRLVRALPRRRPEDPPDDAGIEPGLAVGAATAPLPDLPALRHGVGEADALLGARVAPADAVIAAWVALEEAAGRSGVPRDRAATPTEFTLEVMDRTPADRTAVRTLLALYLRARFGTDPLGPDDVAAALAAVRTLARGLSAGDES